ncbi:MAG: GDP-mannose 4,6-dehydratase [Planctomycetota bacterium]
MRVLVTGGAGFIGSHVCEALLARGDAVRVLDNLDPFYDPAIKRGNLARLEALAREGGAALDVHIGDLRDPAAVGAAAAGVDAVVHLAALAGVRPSIERPADYWDVNLVGTQRLLDAIAPAGTGLVFGSSSSVYGGNAKVPFHEDDPVDTPISPYAATKRAGELACRTHHALHGGDVTCLRFFTVYGPRQRPEMAIHMFTRRIRAGEPIPCFGDGGTSRDYTYVSDIVAGVLAALDRLGGSRLYNLGGSRTTTLRELVGLIAGALGREAVVEALPDQPGDVPRTFADISRAAAELGYAPEVPIEEGVRRFVAWYVEARARGEVA